MNGIPIVTEQAKTLFEQHAQTVLTSLAVMIMAWVGYTLTGLQTTIAGMAVEIRTLQGEVQHLRTLASDRYTATQADRDKAQVRQEIDRIHSRLRSLESRGN
jgi:hypothetical protein